jgi:hypothetical protein
VQLHLLMLHTDVTSHKEHTLCFVRDDTARQLRHYLSRIWSQKSGSHRGSSLGRRDHNLTHMLCLIFCSEYGCRRAMLNIANDCQAIHCHISIYSSHEILVYLAKLRKVNLSLCLTDKAPHHEHVWGSGCIDPRFLDFDTSWR